MEHLSTATVNAIVKQIKDLQKNPAEGITVRLVFFFGSCEMRARARERERDERRQLLLGIPLSLSLSLLLLLLLPLSSFSSSSSSSSSFSNATLAFYSPKFTINKRN